MGIRGLTTYLENKSQQYFEDYELYNCNLVIDGHNLCYNLYNWHYDYWKTGYSPYCYGGDYDKHAEIVKCFFNMLKKSNVTPYIVFDGCSECDKVSLIKERLTEKVKINSNIVPNAQEPNYAVGAVALRFSFRDVLTELKLKSFTCTSEANRRMACLAKHLKCPVLSEDSDFFVSSALFIPFSSIDCELKQNRYKTRSAITCKLYNIENLKHALNKRTDIHYLIPVLIGNSSTDPNTFNAFFKTVRIYGGRQKKIEATFQWLRHQNSLETAIQEILKCFFRKEEKSFALKIIKKAIMGYSPVLITGLLEHFNIKTCQTNETLSVNFEKLEEALGLRNEKANINYQVAELFKKKFSESQYPAFFIDMLLANRYFVWPNIEDCSKPDANSIGYKIMSAIHHILVQNDEKRLTVLRRNSRLELEEYVLPVFEKQLPSIEEMEHLDLESRQGLILEILEIDKTFCEIFANYPKEWHLFLLSLKQTASKTQFQASFIHSLIISFITLNYVDSKLDKVCRCFDELYNIKKFLHSAQNSDFKVKGTDLPDISEVDSFTFMHNIIKHFQVDPEDNAETYDREIVHSVAEFQCVFLHLKYLNNLLNFPFEDALIYKIFDGTFIYNMTKHLRHESNLKDYLISFLSDSPTILHQINYVIEFLERYSVL